MITEGQRLERRNYLGSSDIAAIFTDDTGMSLDPFKTSGDVWALKCFDVEPINKTSESIKGGIRWEPYIIDWAAEQLGVEIETNPEKLRFINNEILDANGNPIFACNLDGYCFIDKSPVIIEAKKTRLWKEWGAEDTDEIPNRVILQVHHQMLCTGWDFAYVAAMIQGDEKLFPIERNESIIKAIVERGLWFWNNHVLTRTPPPQNEPGNLDILKRVVRQPETFADVDSTLILEWETLNNIELNVEKEAKEKLTEILLKLGDAEGVHLSDGRMFTYLKQKGADVIDRKALQAQYPEAYSAVSKENQYRVARIKKG
jgi:predicted phage-related endonuclease